MIIKQLVQLTSADHCTLSDASATPTRACTG